MLNVATESLDLFNDKLFAQKTFEFPFACFADKLAARVVVVVVVDFEVPVADEILTFAIIIDNV